MLIDSEQLETRVPFQHVVSSPTVTATSHIEVTARVDDRSLARLESRVMVDTPSMGMTVNVHATRAGVGGHYPPGPRLAAPACEMMTEADFGFYKYPSKRRNAPPVFTLAEAVFTDESAEPGFIIDYLRKTIFMVALRLQQLGLELRLSEGFHQPILRVEVRFKISMKGGESLEHSSWARFVPVHEGRHISRVTNIYYDIRAEAGYSVPKPGVPFVRNFWVGVRVPYDQKSLWRSTGNLSTLNRLGLVVSAPTAFESLLESCGLELFLLKSAYSHGETP